MRYWPGSKVTLNDTEQVPDWLVLDDPEVTEESVAKPEPKSKRRKAIKVESGLES